MGIKIRRNNGKSGLADVRPLKKSVVVTFDDGDSYDLPMDGWKFDRKAGKYIVTLDRDNTKIRYLNPVGGSYIVKVKRFANRKEDVPQSRIQRGGTYPRRDGKGTFMVPDRLVFDIETEVLDGFYAGLGINVSLNYAFQRAPNGPFSDIVDTKVGLEKIEKFFRACGAGNIAILEIPFSDNVLPWLEKHVLAHSKPFTLVTNEKGYMDSVSELPDGLFKEPTKKKAKK